MEHSGNILIKAAARDMAARLNPDATVLDALKRLYVDNRRLKQRLAECLPQLVIISIKAFPGHVKHFPDKGKTIAVHAA